MSRSICSCPNTRKEPVRFDSFRFRTSRKLVGSVRPVRFGFLFLPVILLNVSWAITPQPLRTFSFLLSDVFSFSLRLRTFREFIGPVRFASDKYLPCFSAAVRKVFGPVRFGSDKYLPCFSAASWLGPVRFGLVPRPVPAGSRIKRCGSARLGRFGSVSYSVLMFSFFLSQRHI